MSLPLEQPHAHGGACQSRFRRDVHQGHCSFGSASPGRTAAAQVVVFSRPMFLLGRLAQLCLQHAVHRGLPRVPHQLFSRWDVGALPQHAASRLCYPRSACARGGGGSHRLADPVASRRVLITVTRCRASLLHAARCLSDARCWTQRRPPAGPSDGRRLVPSGRTFRKTVVRRQGRLHHRRSGGIAKLE